MQKVRSFLSLLKNNKQIDTKTTKQITILTLCKYDTYNPKQQCEQQDKNKSEDKAKTIIKEDKEDKEDKEVNPPPGKPADFIDQIVELFCVAHGRYEIISRGKERAAAGKLLKIYKEKYPAATSDETLSSLKDYFDRCVNISDSWLKQNMSLPIIIDKFNVINNILKNGNNKGSGVTETELANILARKIGIQ
jgi:hypothetical protein